jgi:hypothetical protein
MTARQAPGEVLTAPGSVLTLITDMTAADVDAAVAVDVAYGGSAITLTGVHWRIFEQLHLVDGIVLQTADGVTYLGRLQDDNDARAELTIELT